MRPPRIGKVTVLSFAAFAVIVGAFVYAVQMERRVYQSYESEVTMREAMSSVRALQLNARALQSERANLVFIKR